MGHGAVRDGRHAELPDRDAGAGALTGRTTKCLRPRDTQEYGEDAYPDLDAKAAALLQSIVTGHALADGDKRLGWVAVRLFYRLNGRDLRAPVEDAFVVVASIAEGSLRDVADIAARLREWAVDHEV